MLPTDTHSLAASSQPAQAGTQDGSEGSAEKQLSLPLSHVPPRCISFLSLSLGAAGDPLSLQSGIWY